MSDNLFIVCIKYMHRADPPDDLPRVLAEMCVEHAGLKTAADQLMKATGWTPGCGFSPSYQHLPPPTKTRPKETLARMRQNRATKRAQTRYPLFAEQFTAEIIAANADYYIQGNSPYDEEKAALLEGERQRFEHFSANIGHLFLYGTLNKETQP